MTLTFAPPKAAALLVLALSLPAVAFQGLGAPPAAPAAAKPDNPPPAPPLGATNVDRFAKMVQSYYANLDLDQRNKARKELEKLIEETGKVAKAMKVSDTLLGLPDWREILRRGYNVVKPAAEITWSLDFRVATIDSPMPAELDAKALLGVFDNKLKAFVSVPPDHKKVAYPVLVALHHIDDEGGKALKDMAKSKAIADKIKAWAAVTYPKELLTRAIVVIPIMDYVQRGKDGITFSRPQWDTDEGALWCFGSVRDLIFKALNYDVSRIFIDGHGSGARAAMLYCARFPGLQTGAVVRGPAAQTITFDNCAGIPMLFMGAEAKPFFTEWSVEVEVEPGQPPKPRRPKEGFVLEHKDALDVAPLLQWMADHGKNFAPKRIKFETDEVKYASSYWLYVTDIDPAVEKEKIVVEAVIDREKNEILVSTSAKVKAFEIYVNDDVIDLGRKVRLLHRKIGDEQSTERFNETLTRSLELTLDNYYKRPYCNSGEVYVNMIRVELN